jgi:hypothetical protein
MANTYYNPGFGEMNGQLSIVNNLASGQNWYTTKQLTLTAAGSDLTSAYPNLFCMQVENLAGATSGVKATAWDDAFTKQTINFANGVNRQPWLTRLDTTSADQTVNLKLYFVKMNPNLA